MKPISPNDMPAVVTENYPSDSTLTIREVCAGCGGAGFFLLRVPHGHPEFGKPKPCECQAGKPLPGQVAMLARLRDELGQLADCTFDTFNLDRRLESFVWQGET